MNEGRTGTIGPPMFGRALAGRDGTLCESGAILGENGGRGAGALAVSMRRSISSLMTTERGATIHAFLEKARDQLSGEFPDLRRVAAENLMYVKEDLIVPSHFSFHDLIVAKARGKSGPMFDFSAREDVRLVGDVRTESDAVHPGKVCLRAWYERNKHIFPASRWENYEPGVDHGERYTVKG